MTGEQNMKTAVLGVGLLLVAVWCLLSWLDDASKGAAVQLSEPEPHYSAFEISHDLRVGSWQPGCPELSPPLQPHLIGIIVDGSKVYPYTWQYQIIKKNQAQALADAMIDRWKRFKALHSEKGGSD